MLKFMTNDFDNAKTQYEVTVSQTKHKIATFFDIGCGTGKHVDVFNKKGLKLKVDKHYG